MKFIIIGCLAFVFFYIFDLNKVRLRKSGFNYSFAMGIAVLFASTAGILLGDYRSFALSTTLRVIFGLLTVVSFCGLLYTLFIALPFDAAYGKGQENTVVDRGMYACCRHPGVIWFFFFYFFLWLASGKMIMAWAGITWTAMNIIYVYIEDRWFFPAIFNDYDLYKSKVPFLIPSLISIKKCGVLKQGDLR